MGVRKGIREDIPSHPRAHLYLGARVPERQVTPEGVEQHVPSLTFEVTKDATEYTITYTVTGHFEWKVDGGVWADDVDGSPLVVTRTSEDQTLFMRATVGNNRHVYSVPINALAGSSGTLVVITRVYAEVSGSEIQVYFTITGDYNHTHVLWRQTEVAGDWTEHAQSDDLFDPEPFNPNTAGSETRSIDIYIEAHDASHNVLAASAAITFTFPADADT